MGERGLHVHVNRPARCDELSSWRSIYSNYYGPYMKLLRFLGLGPRYGKGLPVMANSATVIGM